MVLGNQGCMYPDVYLNSVDREKGYSGTSGKCDNNSVSQWSRFTGDAGRKMATHCVPINHCGTESPGWLSGQHPTKAQGIVERKVCFNWNGDCCHWSVNIRVQNCNEYYFYELPKVPRCNLRYCGDNSLDFIHWPSGSYGIPRPSSGCPYKSNVNWRYGNRYQDTSNDGYGHNYKSRESFHLGATVTYAGVERSFCMKTDTSSDVNRNPWPKGQYCIYKKGGTCPTGLTSGSVFWDDRFPRNENTMSGTLPDGSYRFPGYTKIEFCCRTDGEKRVPISLPTKEPFFLLAYNSSECQQVKWAVSSQEYIAIVTQLSPWNDYGFSKQGSHPYSFGSKNVNALIYCYYRGCNNTLTTANGTFHSPNYPNRYPSGQYCSWEITVDSGLQIHLTFTNFNLESVNNTDAIYVYDGVNEAGTVLGVFDGNRPPPEEGINSSANSIFVIFKSNQSAFTGFNASYDTIAIPTPTPTPTPSMSVQGTPTILSSSGIGTVAIVLIPLFGVAALVGVIVFIYCFINYRRKRALEAQQSRAAEVEFHAPFDSVSVDRPQPQMSRKDSPPSSDEESTQERPPAFNPGLAGRVFYSSQEKTAKALSRRTVPSIKFVSYPRVQIEPSAPPESALDYYESTS